MNNAKENVEKMKANLEKEFRTPSKNTYQGLVIVPQAPSATPQASRRTSRSTSTTATPPKPFKPFQTPLSRRRVATEVPMQRKTTVEKRKQRNTQKGRRSEQ